MISKINRCYIIAEAGLNHNGSVEIAKKLIDVAADAGVDAVKFQKRTVDILATKETLDALDDRFPEFGSTYREIREYLEFDFEQYIELMKYSRSKGLDFIVTAFDREAVDFLLKVGVEVFKLASHSLTNFDLLEYWDLVMIESYPLKGFVHRGSRTGDYSGGGLLSPPHPPQGY